MAVYDAGELIESRGLLQVFEAEGEFLSSVSMIFGSYGRIQTSHLIARLYFLNQKPDSGQLEHLSRAAFSDSFGTALDELIGSPIAEIRELSAAIQDNTELDLFIEPLTHLENGFYLLHVFSPDALRGNAPTIWLSDEHDRIPGHFWCSVGKVDTADMGVRGWLGYSPPVANTDVPPSLLISPVTQCNLNCIHCVSKYTRGTVSSLRPSVRDEILRWCSENRVEAIATDYSGDLLWADLKYGGELDFIERLSKPFHITTNGTHLTASVSRRLMAGPIRSINVSLDAARDKTFRRIRKGAPPLSDVIDNMRVLASEREIAGRLDVGLTIGFTLMRSNLEEVGEALELVKSTGFDELNVRHLEAYTEDMESESMWFDMQRYNDAYQTISASAKLLDVKVGLPPPFEFRPETLGHRACREPWRSAVILGNGDVRVCCVPGPGMVMGNLNDDPMEEIWNGPLYRDFRTRVNSAAPPVSCRVCPMYRKPNNRLSYMPHHLVHEEAVAKRLGKGPVL